MTEPPKKGAPDVEEEPDDAEAKVVEGEILPPEVMPVFSGDEPDPGTQDAEEAAAAYQAQAAGEDALPDRRVLQVMAGAGQGGAEAFFERLVIALQQAGLEQRVIIRRDEERASRLEAAGLTVLQLPFRRWFDFTTTPAIAQEIKDFEPDLVMSYMSRAAAAVPRDVPGRSFVHVARLGGYYDLKYYRNCDHLIGNTRDLVRYLVEQDWPRERAHYITNFVETEISEPLPRETFATRPEHDLLLALGRLHPNKGFDTLIEAMPALPECSLWIAGEGPERRKLEKLARRLGVEDRVRLLGWRDDTSALFAAADLFVCSSRHEPLGNIVLEAWAYGRPVVALAAQGPSELITDGETGILVPLENPAALARAIDDLLHAPLEYDKLMTAGRKAYEKDHTATAVVRRYLEFIAFATGTVREAGESQADMETP